MNHRETLGYLESKGNEVQMMHLGLHRTVAMLAALGDPHLQYPAVHIAGTNGKGSVAAMTEAILRAAGLRTGMYTSPHLVRVEERMRVDGVPVAAGAFAALGTRVRRAEEALLGDGTMDRPLTTFEFLTCCAFLHFARRRVDVAVLEVGLGGKLDATNVVTPLASVVTGVALDHQQYLGDTVRKIAAEKAGVIKKGVPAVSGCGDPAAQDVMRRRAAAVKTTLLELGRDFHVLDARMRGGRCTMDLQTPMRRYAGLRLALAGGYQARNAALAVAAVEAMGARWGARDAAQGREGFPVTIDAVRRGLAGTRWEGRLDEYAAVRRTLLDGAHNPEAALLLRDHLLARKEGELHMVFGAVRDKNIREVGAAVFPLAKRIYLTPLFNTRTSSPEEVAAMFPEHRERMEVCKDMRSALRAAWRNCPGKGLTVVTGSLYLVGALLPAVQKSAAGRA
ncbi:MAG: bifunctional folylpolyglutamate synthase/dihydrofolate synthase [Acidobacteriota bacterium]|jgi:dihydrofolate synthase/folylpolyglutamate synthase|nr:bifunctional folylpolyglutamate synthase/dihydrofolate synthase [Acidobacteriota bacterium]